MIILNFLEKPYWILGLIFINEVKTTCLTVNSTKSGSFNVVKGKTVDSRCLDGVILENEKAERYELFIFIAFKLCYFSE